MKIFAALLLCSSALLAQAPAPAKSPKKPAPAADPATPAAPVREAKPAKAQAKGAGLVASKDTKTFHRHDCKFAVKIKPENRVIYADKAEAEKDGAKPCKICKP